MVAGRADTQPLFPDDPFIAANRRVTITLMREEPPIPQNLQAIVRQVSCNGCSAAGQCWRNQASLIVLLLAEAVM